MHYWKSNTFFNFTPKTTKLWELLNGENPPEGAGKDKQRYDKMITGKFWKIIASFHQYFPNPFLKMDNHFMKISL